MDDVKIFEPEVRCSQCTCSIGCPFIRGSSACKVRLEMNKPIDRSKKL